MKSCHKIYFVLTLRRSTKNLLFSINSSDPYHLVQGLWKAYNSNSRKLTVSIQILPFHTALVNFLFSIRPLDPITP